MIEVTLGNPDEFKRKAEKFSEAIATVHTVMGVIPGLKDLADNLICEDSNAK